MQRRAAIVVAVLSACGSKDSGTGGRFEIKRTVHTDSTQTAGLPMGNESIDDAEPAYDITGITGALADGMRGRIVTDALARKGRIRVDVALTPSPPPSGAGHVDFTLTLDATYAALPQLIRLDATITGGLDYRGTDAAKLGAELGDIVADHIAAAKLPPTVGFPTEPPPKVIGIAASDQGCSVHEGGSVRCWSSNGRGTEVPAAGNALAADAANNFGTCVLKKDGSVHCIDAWDNVHGLVVKEVCGVEGATEVGVGQDGACARLANGHVRCWSRTPKAFEPCDADTGANGAVVEVKGLSDAVAMNVGAHRGCAITKSGRVACWEHCGPRCDAPPTAKPVPGLAKITAIAEGFAVCGVHGGTNVTCFAHDTKQQTKLVLPEEVTALSTSVMQVYALGASGKLYSWPAGTAKTTPTLVAGLGDVAKLDCDLGGSCALLATGEVKCWGGIDEVPPESAKTIVLR